MGQHTTIKTTPRAFCPECHEFSVTPKRSRCVLCGRGKRRDYEFVAVAISPNREQPKPS